MLLLMDHKPLPEISPRAWEHPADRAALTALKQVPGLDEVVRFFVGMTGEKSWRLFFLARSVRVGPRQFARLHELLKEACRVLDTEDIPELFVTQDPSLNAGAIGVKKPFIILNSSMLDTLDDEETLSVLAHELAHILSGHVLYKTLLWMLVQNAGLLITLPIARAVLTGLMLALTEWDRKSELSADRAGLLVVQDPEVSVRLLMKLAGGKHLEEMNIDEFRAQADEYDAGGDVIDGVYKLLNLLGQTHPFPVLRVRAIDRWSREGDYEAILKGEYPLRTEEEENIARDFEQANAAYREEMRQSKDPLAKAFDGIGESLDSARQEAQKFFDGLFGK